MTNYLTRLNEIYENVFLVEAKGTPYESANYTNTIAESIVLKNSIHPRSQRERLLYTCQVNKCFAAHEFERRWNFINLVSTTVATIISIYALMTSVFDPEQSTAFVCYVIAISSILLIAVLMYSLRSPVSAKREIFYDLVAEILKDDIETNKSKQ